MRSKKNGVHGCADLDLEAWTCGQIFMEQIYDFDFVLISSKPVNGVVPLPIVPDDPSLEGVNIIFILLKYWLELL